MLSGDAAKPLFVLLTRSIDSAGKGRLFFKQELLFMRYRIILGLAFSLAGLDQLSKWAVEKSIPPYESFSITGFFNLVNIRNHGAAFGFLNDPEISWQFWLFLGTTLLAIGVMLFMAHKAEARDTLLFVALGSIMGGALGNLVDRIRYRAVVDFLDFHYAGWHWPAFNLADIAICFGACLTALFIWRSPVSGPPRS